MNYYLEKIYLKYIVCRDSMDGSRMRKYVEKAYAIRIGKYTYGYNFHDIARGTQIGSFCSIASGVKIGQFNHPVHYVSSHPFLYYKNRGFVKEDKEVLQKSAVVVEDDVWIGANAVILPGVKLGRGCVVGAGSVVTKNVPPYAIVGGVKADIIKYRFDQETIDGLLEIDWPSWDDEKIRENLELFYEPMELLKAYKNGMI